MKLLGVDPFRVDVSIKRLPENSQPFSALAFKIMTDPYVGKLTYMRVYSGSLDAGSYVYNPSSGKKERISRILLMHSNKREERNSVSSGEIVAAVGLKNVKTGNTLCDEKNKIMLESMDFPEPVVAVSVEPVSKGDQDLLSKGLQKLERKIQLLKFQPMKKQVKQLYLEWVSFILIFLLIAKKRIQSES